MISKLKSLSENDLLLFIKVEIFLENKLHEILKKEAADSLLLLEKTCAKIEDKKLDKHSAYFKCFATVSSCIKLSEMLSFKKIIIHDR